LAIKK